MLEHTGLNKLDGFGPIYVINLKSRTDRLNYIEGQLKENDLLNYKVIEATHGETADWSNLVFERDSLSLSNSELGATVSHLNTIKEWFETSDSEYAIIIEDDLSFETVKYWNFTFKEFVDSIKKKYDILQFCILKSTEIGQQHVI